MYFLGSLKIQGGTSNPSKGVVRAPPLWRDGIRGGRRGVRDVYRKWR